MEPKEFRWEVPEAGGWRSARNGEGNPGVLYRLTEIVEADVVHVHEGEKAADAFAALGHAATCAPTTAWTAELAASLSGKCVVIWQDRDEAGRRRAGKAVDFLRAMAKTLRVVEAAVQEKGADGYDHLEAGFGLAEAREVVIAREREAPTARRLPPPTTKPLSEIIAKPTEWLWEGRIPKGELTILDGDPGLGKTTLALDVAARESSGAPMPLTADAGRRRGRVLYVTGEDSHDRTLRPRLEAAGADLDSVLVFTGDELPSLPSGIDDLAYVIGAEGVTLVMFDPLPAFLDPEINAHRDADVRRALRPLRSLSSETGCAILGIRHLNKQTSNSNPLYRGGGSIAWTAAARSGLLAAEHPRDPQQRVLAQSKTNLGPLAPSLGYRLETVPVPNAGTQVRVEWLGTVDYKAADLLQQRRQGRAEKRGACQEWLAKRLSGGGGVAFKRLLVEAEAWGWGEKLLQRAGEDLGVRKEREERFQGGTLWSLG